MKPIRIILSKEAWEELRSIREELGTDELRALMGEQPQPKKYEEYLEREKQFPHWAWLG